MSSTTLLTVEQFEHMPLEEGVRYELKNGELIPMAMAKFGHEITKSVVARCLYGYTLQQPIGWVFSETVFALSPTRVCIPDIAFLSNESIAKGDREHIYRGAPDLTIEIVSESESAADLRAKVRDYLEAGSKAVWLFYPDLRVIAVYSGHGLMELFSGQVLEAPDILPGFRASVDEFFV